ncbi:helix-turn-helix domain-containing protein [Streptomyces sp. NPDC001315]|uniref:helix-turn-helix domain-containing protein n=1 Tax=Streptomyces sp. NPDC001315 TaxID=3364562 RepID=UPI0036B48E34
MTRKAEWSPEVRAALQADLRLTYEAAQHAETLFKIRIYIAVEQGLTTREVAAELGMSQQTVSRYRIEGEAAFAARQAVASD